MDGEVFVDPVVWLFALPEPSRAQAQSPILTPAEITAIRESSAAQENLKKAVELMSGFCQRSDHWLTRYRHRKGGQIRFGRFRACGCAHGKLRAVLRCGTHIAQQENAMAKGQKRSGREAKKPKQAKSTPPTAKSSVGTTSMQQLISSMTRGSSKNK